MRKRSVRIPAAFLVVGLMMVGWPSIAQLQESDLVRFLAFVQRDEFQYTFELQSSKEPYQVKVIMPDGTELPWPVETKKRFPYYDRFVASKFDKKSRGKKDISELTVEDTYQKRKIILVKGAPQKFSDFEAVFEWSRTNPERIKLREGGRFRIPGEGDATYLLTKLQENSVTIAPILPDGSLGKEMVIKKK